MTFLGFALWLNDFFRFAVKRDSLTKFCGGPLYGQAEFWKSANSFYIDKRV
jgi:hypothetical protein